MFVNLVIGLALRALDKEVSERTAIEIKSGPETMGHVLIAINSLLLFATVWELAAQLLAP